MTYPVRIKDSFLLLMGQEAFEIYKTNRKADIADTLKEVQKFMADHFVPKKSEYGEILSYYAMKLRTLAKFGATLDKEIERRFVVGFEMDEVQRKCCRKDNL